MRARRSLKFLRNRPEIYAFILIATVKSFLKGTEGKKDRAVTIVQSSLPQPLGKESPIEKWFGVVHSLNIMINIHLKHVFADPA